MQIKGQLKMIAIIDYGAGNVKSLQFALEKLNIASTVTTDPEVIMNSKAMILPGVGAFRDAMQELIKSELIPVIKQEVANGKPLLGICLGMQMFYDKSFEGGEWDGLGLLQGEISRIPETVKVPHMGWNNLNHQQQDVAILKDVPEDAFVYFVHSYYAAKTKQENLVSSCAYAVDIPAIVQKDNIIGIQFHPEKSGKTGLQILNNFGEMLK